MQGVEMTDGFRYMSTSVYERGAIKMLRIDRMTVVCLIYKHGRLSREEANSCPLVAVLLLRLICICVRAIVTIANVMYIN